MCCLLDGLPISSIKQAKESDRSIFLVLFPKKVPVTLAASLCLFNDLQWPPAFQGNDSSSALSLISSQSVPHYFHPLAREILKSSSTFPSFVCKPASHVESLTPRHDTGALPVTQAQSRSGILLMDLLVYVQFHAHCLQNCSLEFPFISLSKF